MTAYRFVTLTCDVCLQGFSGEACRTVASTRKRARGNGWIRSGRSDICAGCAQRKRYALRVSTAEASGSIHAATITAKLKGGRRASSIKIIRPSLGGEDAGE